MRSQKEFYWKKNQNVSYQIPVLSVTFFNVSYKLLPKYQYFYLWIYHPIKQYLYCQRRDSIFSNKQKYSHVIHQIHIVPQWWTVRRDCLSGFNSAPNQWSVNTASSIKMAHLYLLHLVLWVIACPVCSVWFNKCSTDTIFYSHGYFSSNRTVQ